MRESKERVTQRKGKRTLAESCEELIREWNFEKNGNLTPFNVLRNDGRRVYWICSHCGQEFQNSVKSRYYRKTKCPHCLGQSTSDPKRAHKFDQSLGYLYPYLMKEWHPTLNGRWNAFKLSPASSERVWWRCSNPDCQMEWRVSIGQRVYQQVSCPNCQLTKEKSETLLKKIA